MRLRFILTFILLTIIAVALSAQDDSLITTGTYEGLITDDDDSDTYTFEAVIGQEVVISMEAAEDSTLDATLRLIDPNGFEVVTDDDSGDNRNALIEYVPIETGIYTIVATRYDEGTTLTIGAYQLTLSISTPFDPLDPFSVAPDFDVPFNLIDIDATATAAFTAADGTNLQYYVIGAEQGDFIRVRLTTEGNLVANVRILSRINQTLTEISNRNVNSDTAEVIFTTIPQSGWHLIEISRESGIGAYQLTPTLVSDTLLTVDNPIEGAFDGSSDPQFFIFNATISEDVFVDLVVTEGNNVRPQLTVLDLAQIQQAQSASRGSRVRASFEVPRSSPYIVRVDNLAPARGTFQLELRRRGVNISKLPIDPINYNDRALGLINDNSPIDYYRFSGKAGELVTIEMNPLSNPDTVDAYLILADSALNELIFNDNASASSSARINQFALPADGDYFILATRAGLSLGITQGLYELKLTVGELSRETGVLTATLTWEGEADLNLFLQTPNRGTISWANPTIRDGGTLQIDSNTNCETPTNQPIEHIFWTDTETLDQGDYIFWVWYQNDCMMSGETAFTLEIAYNGEVILPSRQTVVPPLLPNERYETSFRLTSDGQANAVNLGTVRTPSAQEAESQGGDQLIVYGDVVSGNISNEVFAEFYQFVGNAGDQIQVTVERITLDLDPIVILLDDSDANLAANDDLAPDNRNAQLIHTLPEDGRYVIAVTRFGARDGTTTGDYRLILEQASNTAAANDE